ncbi:MAG: alanine dehydrogenase [Chloroflexi bacterium]|nr:alanine dehydrogenase [Chloroflexota bacterium]MDA1145313.1 alanine dehydrogenase [Chloroflexota bacterium]
MAENAMSSVGVPRETKIGEYRVGLTPRVTADLTALGIEVLVERSAGVGAGFPDTAYVDAGARLVDVDGAFGAELVMKVKEPNPDEVARLQRGQTLFTFVHLPGNPQLRAPLEASGATVLAYELLEDELGRNPILAPMSFIAGRLASQIGAHYLEGTSGGRGVLLGAVPGTEPALAVVVGAGVVGRQAAEVAHGMGGRVILVDSREDHARKVAAEVGALATAIEPDQLASVLAEASLIVGAVHRPGEAAPHVVSEQMIATMPPGSVAVDVAIDEGGCFETSRPTSHAEPTYVKHGVIHYCVPNMPSMAAHDATVALVAATRPHILTLVQGGLAVFRTNPGHAKAIAVEPGR